jgi:hypothetical protein
MSSFDIDVTHDGGWRMVYGLDGNIPRSPWKRGLSAHKLICGLTANIVQPRSTETRSRMRRRPRCR